MGLMRLMGPMGQTQSRRRVYSNFKAARFYRRRRTIELSRGMQRPSDCGVDARGLQLESGKASK